MAKKVNDSLMGIKFIIACGISGVLSGIINIWLPYSVAAGTSLFLVLLGGYWFRTTKGNYSFAKWLMLSLCFAIMLTIIIFSISLVSTRL